MTRRVTRRVPVRRWGVRGVSDALDAVSVEEPLEIRLNGEPMVVTMRTPGDDIDLVHGLLHSEGIVAAASDVIAAQYCAGSVVSGETGEPENTYNVLDVTLPPLRAVLARRRGSLLANSACGMCGSESIDAVRRQGVFDVASDAVTVTPEVLLGLPARLREAQVGFDRTGGVHAAGLFTASGEPVVIREDVGRHNAVDKVVGWAVREGRLPLSEHALQVSGRVSFELVQKAYLAGIPVLSAVSAPSSLAVDLAGEVGMTLLGFVREGRMTAYSRPDRVA